MPPSSRDTYTSRSTLPGYITVDSNAGDRNNLTLWHAGEALIAATAAVCSNTIVVQHVVGPVLVESWIDNPNVTAVLHAGLPGQESGNAIVDVLFGAVNPSGRLPYTIAKARGDYPADVLYTTGDTTPQLTYSEALEIDYRLVSRSRLVAMIGGGVLMHCHPCRHFDAKNIEPRFEFGFGLSYTNFTYKDLRVSRGGAPVIKRAVNATSPAAAKPLSPTQPASSTAGRKPASGITANITAALPTTTNSTSTSMPNVTATTSALPAISSPAQTSPGGPAALFQTAWTVSYTVTNTGHTDGHEVSQVYLGFPASANSPPKVLRGFDRSFVKAGHTTTVRVSLRLKDVSVW